MPVHMQLTREILISAYAHGFFPMAEAQDASDIFWMNPEVRGVIPLEGFHISRTLRRAILKGDYEARINTDFQGVIKECSDREETWINLEITRVFTDLFNEGLVQTLEIWRDGRLIGGTYGLTLNGAYFGESMFSRETNASKIALAFLVDHLRETGFHLFDTQFPTDHLTSLGGEAILQGDYFDRLREALAQPANFRAIPTLPDPQELIARYHAR